MLKHIVRTNNKEAESDTTTSIKKMKFCEKPSAKKKNTYLIKTNAFAMPGAFAYSKTTPLAVVEINGVPTDNANGGWMECTQFPNPGASQIDVLNNKTPEWRIIMGEKMAHTIIEYLDKETFQPVLILYPNGSVQSQIPDTDAKTVFATRLNHASRRDFIRQYRRIAKKIRIVSPLIAERNRAMENAPRSSYEAYNAFIAELDRKQIERAKALVARRQK